MCADQLIVTLMTQPIQNLPQSRFGSVGKSQFLYRCQIATLSFHQQPVRLKRAGCFVFPVASTCGASASTWSDLGHSEDSCSRVSLPESQARGYNMNRCYKQLFILLEKIAMKATCKHFYQTPQLIVHGFIEEVTRATNTGTDVDRQFACASITIGPPCTS